MLIDGGGGGVCVHPCFGTVPNLACHCQNKPPPLALPAAALILAKCHGPFHRVE